MQHLMERSCPVGREVCGAVGVHEIGSVLWGGEDEQEASVVF